MIHRKFIYVLFLIICFSNISFEQTVGFHSNLKANCKFCHISLGKDTNNINLVWQKDLSRNYYTPYSSSTLDAEISQPSGSSKLCLSCHDGTLSLDHINLPNLSSTQILGNDLRSSHPVSFKYDSYLAMKDGELYDPVSSPSGLGGTIYSDLLIDGNLECISCHDIHGMRGQKNLLVKSNYKSKLCLTCHAK